MNRMFLYEIKYVSPKEDKYDLLRFSVYRGGYYQAHPNSIGGMIKLFNRSKIYNKVSLK